MSLNDTLAPSPCDCSRPKPLFIKDAWKTILTVGSSMRLVPGIHPQMQISKAFDVGLSLILAIGSRQLRIEFCELLHDLHAKAINPPHLEKMAQFQIMANNLRSMTDEEFEQAREEAMKQAKEGADTTSQIIVPGGMSNV